jgi:hypothetical protein
MKFYTNILWNIKIGLNLSSLIPTTNTRVHSSHETTEQISLIQSLLRMKIERKVLQNRKAEIFFILKVSEFTRNDILWCHMLLPLTVSHVFVNDLQRPDLLLLYQRKSGLLAIIIVKFIGFLFRKGCFQVCILLSFETCVIFCKITFIASKFIIVYLSFLIFILGVKVIDVESLRKGSSQFDFD